MDIIDIILGAKLGGGGGGSGSEGSSSFIPSFGTIAYVDLGTTWAGNDPYTSTVTVTGYTVTDKTMVSVLPSTAVLTQMLSDGTTNIFITNNNGVLTATAHGAAPTYAMTLTVLCTESDQAAAIGNLPAIVGDGVLEVLGATDLTDAVNLLNTDVSDVKNAIDENTTELAMLIEKREIPPEPPTTIVQVCDITNATKKQYQSGRYYWENIKIDLPYIGNYYFNPSGGVVNNVSELKAYNSSGELIQLYRNGSSWNSIGFEGTHYLEKVDSRTLVERYASGGVCWTWTTDDDLAYLGGASSIIVGTMDAEQLVGVTYPEASGTYVPSSVTPDVDPEYEYVYADDLMDAVYGDLIEKHTDDEPQEGSAKFVKSGGVVSYAFKDSYNLVDPDWFVWDGSASIVLKAGLYIAVDEAKNLICNCEKVVYQFYDSSTTSLGTRGTAVAYDAVTVPSGAVKMRVSLDNGTGYIPSDHTVVIYYSNSDESPKDDRREYIPHKNLQGWRGSSEIFDYYAPLSLDKEILQMAKYSAVRNINYCSNILRIGTFNMYLPMTYSGWSLAKKMFADYAVDIVGFQEVSGGGRILTEFLKGWQFTDGVTDAPVAVASHFKVLSYNTYTFNVTERKWMRAIIQLPRYADAIDPTLSIYDYHAIWDGGTPEKRAQEVGEMLAVIAQDTSDFKVVVGDTNVASPSEWAVWSNAGFTPVNDGNGTITTVDGECLDNIFIPSGITCKDWHVVPAEDYPISSNVPISDHDFVFADLQFDFDSLVRT